VFEQLQRFVFVHHRALNGKEMLARAVSLAATRPDLDHAVEGDICWNVSGGRRDFYFRHPRLVSDVLSEREIDEAVERGELFTLTDLLSAPESGVRYVVELKNGAGDLGEAARRIVGLLQEGLRDRFWIDTFSLRHLQAVKAADGTVPTSLHTKLIAGAWLVRTAPEILPLSVHGIASLEDVDAVTLTYHSSAARWLAPFGATIDRTCAGVLRAGKQLVLGGLKTPEMFERARNSPAVAGYAKFPLGQVREASAVPLAGASM